MVGVAGLSFGWVSAGAAFGAAGDAAKAAGPSFGTAEEEGVGFGVTGVPGGDGSMSEKQCEINHCKPVQQEITMSFCEYVKSTMLNFTVMALSA